MLNYIKNLFRHNQNNSQEQLLNQQKPIDLEKTIEDKPNVQENANVEKAIKWLQKKTKTKKFKCETCGTNDWIVEKDIFTPTRWDFNLKAPINDVSIPSYVCICKNCGNTKFFNAMFMGIVKNE